MARAQSLQMYKGAKFRIRVRKEGRVYCFRLSRQFRFKYCNCHKHIITQDNKPANGDGLVH